MTEDEELRLKEEVAAGEQVSRVLRDPFFVEAVAELRGQWFSEFAATTFPQDEERRGLWAKMTALDDVLNALNTKLQTGEMAQHSLGQVSDDGRRDPG